MCEHFTNNKCNVNTQGCCTLDLVSMKQATYLRCVRKLPLMCPEPSHPGVGQDIPSVFPDFQENCEPFI